MSNGLAVSEITDSLAALLIRLCLLLICWRCGGELTVPLLLCLGKMSDHTTEVWGNTEAIYLRSLLIHLISLPCIRVTKSFPPE